MRRKISLYLVALTIILLLGFAVPTGQAISQPNPGDPQPGSDEAAFAPGRILVKVKDNAPADALASVNRENDARVEDKIPHTRVSIVDLPHGLSVTEAVETYEDAPQVEYAEPDYEVQLAQSALPPNDPNFPNLYGLNNTGQAGGAYDADIDAPEAWTATTGSSEVVVAVIDTGMDIDHQDLDGNIWTNPGEIAGNGIDDDRNGYVDDVKGWDFYHDDNSVFDSAEADRHATHVAGTIAAETNNRVGVAGVAWQVKIMPLKFIGPERGYVSYAAEALRYAVDQGAAISNHSYGYYDLTSSGSFSKTLRDAVDYADKAGHLVVAAAMNGGADRVGDDNDQLPYYPASHQTENVISVAASNKHDTLASFSNYGATSVDLAAPGEEIYSTVPGNAYSYGSGTSMATPHVTGTAVLLKSQFPELSATAIKDRILSSVDPKASLQGKTVSGGRLNAVKALGVPLVSKVSPTSKRRDRTPTIRAVVQDTDSELIQTDMELYLDGVEVSDFSYDQTTDTLTFTPRRGLSFDRHHVKVIVQDGQGIDNTRAWSFRVVRRR
jgi:thermitase